MPDNGVSLRINVERRSRISHFASSSGLHARERCPNETLTVYTTAPPSSCGLLNRQGDKTPPFCAAR